MRGRLALFAVVLVVLTAGCGGLVGDDGDDDEEGGDRELAPGLAESGVTDSNLLVNEHRSQLEDRPFRTELERTVVDDGTTIGAEHVSQAVAAGGAPARERTVLEDDTGTVEYDQWIQPETPLVRHNESGSVAYGVGGHQSVGPSPPIPLDDAYDAVDSVAVEEDSSERYVLEGTTEDLGSYESVAFTLVLAEEGYLEAYALEGILPDDEESVLATDRTTVEEEFFLEPTETGPEEPAWLEEAREEIAAEHDD
ncbi:hypothetical protein C491_09954 [Natronococcus amylolyticus DSM 10524]|uniref:Lipoprotein n=1 Tax=Natronococcus amylolyticus DSM 10524 TaxID=1227497 RepID=L9X8R2_9EURY|nr:hypothetical protein [Natronococcus amylolyticus]ELY58110.1 hypothetical protein C491_09954 [Natronococcus amylolyticus DSM 10524]